MTFSEVLSVIVDYAWGLPLVFLLLGGGFYLLMVSRFLPLLGFVHAIKLVTGRFKHKGHDKAEGQISHFKALTNALAATVGLGNIAGVAVAISQGGPGAIFWMWVAAFIGMNTKFFECSLAVMYRGKDYLGEVQGGPMYVIEKALPKFMAPFAIFFAVCGLVGTTALFQTNQLSEYLNAQYQVAPIVPGILSAIFVGVVLFWGVRGIAAVTSKVVPLMCLVYIGCSLTIIISNFDLVPGIFRLIFTEAFNGSAVFGGASGLTVMQIMKIGVKRAVFSNEAGTGSAPMAHSNAKTSEPLAEGFVAMLGPFLDTIVVCTMTALVILTTLQPEEMAGLNGIALTSKAFATTLPSYGNYLLGLCILLFAVSTMLGMANYNEKCWNYLFKGKFIFKKPVFILFFCSTLVYGSYTTPDNVINILDIGYAFMAIPNMIATIWLAGKVKGQLADYMEKYI